MLRIRGSVVAMVALGLSLVAATGLAMDVKGKVTALDLAKQTITVKTDDGDQTFDLSKTIKVYKLYGGGKRAGFDEAPGGMKAVSVGAEVTVSTDFVDSKEQAIRIKLESASGPARRAARPRRKAKRADAKRAAADDEQSSSADIKGHITALNARKLQMTLKVDGKPKVYTVAKDCKVFVIVKKARKPRYDVAPQGLADIKVGLDVTITLDSESGKDRVTMVKINTPPKK